MSYVLNCDPKNTFEGTIIKGLPPDNNLVNGVYYQIPSKQNISFETSMKFNCINYEWVAPEDESEIYILPISEFTFTDAGIVQFNPYQTFAGVVIKLWEAIEESGNKETSIEWNIHPNYKNEFESFSFVNNLKFEFLQEDEHKTTYLISRN